MARVYQEFTYQFPPDGSAYPEHLVDVLWEWAEYNAAQEMPAEVFRPRSKAQLAALVNPAFQASLRTEERRPVRFRAFLSDLPRELTVRFVTPLLYNMTELVKIAPTVDSAHRAIVVVPRTGDSDQLEIVGIRDPTLSPSERSPKRPRWEDLLGLFVKHYEWTVSVFGPGSILVQTLGFPIELRHGRIRCPFPVHRIKHVRQWYREATAEGRLGDQTIASALLGQVWQSILSEVCESHRGGTFLIAPDVPVRDLPLRIKYRLDSNVLVETLQARMTVEPKLSHHLYAGKEIETTALDDAHCLQRGLVRTQNLLAALSSVDGAVVLNRDLHIIGFGAEITLSSPATTDEVIHFGRHPDPVGIPPPRPLLDYGMRHRSAYHFCQAVAGAIAFVVSQDAAITVFCNTQRDPRREEIQADVEMYQGLTPERWLM
ncbi:MAG TPA: hypothetical protein PLL20_05360 [Phycisphaerae bacterium]|nr:hypothetical protein [Phycisphaerae bacterium]HRR83601.1 hypothetical protein [Phycisphaerae bacterium]